MAGYFLGTDMAQGLLYRQGDEKRVWEGPAMPAGAGYRIVIRIEADGTASARHCLSPCSLE